MQLRLKCTSSIGKSTFWTPKLVHYLNPLMSFTRGSLPPVILRELISIEVHPFSGLSLLSLMLPVIVTN